MAPSAYGYQRVDSHTAVLAVSVKPLPKPKTIQAYFGSNEHTTYTRSG
jgi:hypothetical protein